MRLSCCGYVRRNFLCALQSVVQKMFLINTGFVCKAKFDETCLSCRAVYVECVNKTHAAAEEVKN